MSLARVLFGALVRNGVERACTEAGAAWVVGVWQGSTIRPGLSC